MALGLGLWWTRDATMLSWEKRAELAETALSRSESGRSRLRDALAEQRRDDPLVVAEASSSVPRARIDPSEAYNMPVVSVRQNAETTESMLKSSFESMQTTLLTSMAQMMRSGGSVHPAGVHTVTPPMRLSAVQL